MNIDVAGASASHSRSEEQDAVNDPRRPHHREAAETSGRPPLCTGQRCRNHVKPHVGRKPTGLGWRLVDGVAWSWFCSRRCAARVQGQRRAKVFDVEKMAAARMRSAARRRREEWAPDVAALVRYGVPPVLAEAILVRVDQRGFHRGYNLAYVRHKAKRTA